VGLPVRSAALRGIERVRVPDRELFLKLGKTLYVRDRKAWRAWLAKHHAKASEIWLVYYKKSSKKPRIPYNDAVEEALCFGWIDSILKPIDGERFAQRFSPRRATSKLSPMNRVRVERLLATGMMTPAGIEKIRHTLVDAKRPEKSAPFRVPADIARAIEKAPTAWKNFQRFPKTYQRIRVGWIDGARSRPEEFRKRLRYFVKMTAANKRFGMVQ
jgi:uncharacterized protein YdeI (YjbR/CyaY-like superfamily)